MSWIFLADLHISKENLKNHEKTLDWIVEELAIKNEAKHIFILGDTLHTRGDVNIIALSAASQFIKRLLNLPSHPKIHLLVGNHDQHSLRSREITSLDAFSIYSENSFEDTEEKVNVKKSINIYKEITEITINSIPVVFLPFHENQQEIRTFLNDYVEKNSTKKVENTIILGHLALNGCKINGYSDYSNLSRNVNGDLCVADFASFKKTFLGHFHYHQVYGGKIMYVGSPRQMSYGDCGDSKRGFVTYCPVKNQHELQVNPFGVFYVEADLQKIHDLFDKPRTKESLELYQNKFVRLNLPAGENFTNEEIHNLHRKLYNNYKILGFKAFRHKIAIVLSSKEEKEEMYEKMYRPEKTLFQLFQEHTQLDSILDAVEKENIISVMSRIMSNEDDAGMEEKKEYFDGTINCLEITNFLGIQTNLKINFSNIDSGIWFILGKNGSGKSCLLEAICWCLYGKVLRKNLEVKGVINDYSVKPESCVVQIFFKNKYSIRRERKNEHQCAHSVQIIEPSGKIIEKAHVDHTDEEIKSLLGVDYETFTRSVILSSSATSNFINGNPTDQRLIIERLLGFHQFEEYEKNARNIIKEYNNQMKDFVSDLKDLNVKLSYENEKLESQSRIKSNLVQSQNELQKFKIQWSDWEEKTIKSEQCSDKYDNLIEKFSLEQSKCQKKLDDLFFVQGLFMQRSQIMNNIQKLQSELKDHHNTQNLEVNGSILEDAVQTQEEILQILNSQEQDKLVNFSINPLKKYIKSCNLNFREQSQINILQKIRDFNNEIESKLNQLKSLELKIKILHENPIADLDSFSLSSQIAPQQDILKKLQAELHSLKQSKSQLQVDFQKQNEMKDLKQYIVKLECKIDMFQNNLNDAVVNTDSIQAEMKLCNEKIFNLKKEINIAESCLKSLVVNSRSCDSKFRSFCLEKKMKTLNQLLEENMDIMTEDISSVNLSCELTETLRLKETRGGIAMAKRSDGLVRRGHLSLFFTLFTLAQRSLRFRSSFLFLDEPFDSLDEAGHFGVQKWVENLWKNDLVKHIFIITHGNYISPLSKGCIQVELLPSFGSYYKLMLESDLSLAVDNIFIYNDEYQRKSVADKKKRTIAIKRPHVKNKKSKMNDSDSEVSLMSDN